MFSIYGCHRLSTAPAAAVERWKSWRRRRRLETSFLPPQQQRRRIRPWAIASAMKPDSTPLDYDPSRELLGLDVDPNPRITSPAAPKLRSWFGPNGQYIRELPCPSCRGRGYTPCAECDIERSRSDCSQCNGKGIRICQQCSGDCVIWEESIDERPWEKARTSSPFKVKEDDEVDKLDITIDGSRKSKRTYQSPSPEVSLKISRSLRSLNAKTGLFSNRMKIIHQDPMLHAQRVAAIKKAKGTPAARQRASDALKAYFRNPENRHKRSIAMTGVKFYCSHCGEEGHRRHYCPKVREISGPMKFKCRMCGEMGHNRRTCRSSRLDGEPEDKNQTKNRHCRVCGESSHNRRTCPEYKNSEVESSVPQRSPSGNRRTYSCTLCHEKGHNKRTCPRGNDA